MKTLGEAAMELPWLTPSVASMTTLARSSLSQAWTHVRSDPGIVLLSAPLFDSQQPLSTAADVALLDSLVQQQSNYTVASVDWTQSGPASVRAHCYRHALLATELAERAGCDDKQAWIAGFLAPLGWLGAAAVAPREVGEQLSVSRTLMDHLSWQRRVWGHDHAGLARRLCRAWRLPRWVTSILSHLGMRADLAARLGADPQLIRVVQLSILLLQERHAGLGLVVGANTSELLTSLRLHGGDAECSAVAALQATPPVLTWESPAQHTLLPEFLRLALENRRQNDAAWIERLQQELDHLQDALAQEGAVETNRLNNMKLSSLAEFAAGAGHEINNPLAVISGQAQYVLKQMDWLNVPAEEIENVGEYLDGLREKVTPSLQKIIGQTQRIHGILKELMQFARPLPPDMQLMSVSDLVRDVVDSLQALAAEHQVQVRVPPLDSDVMLHADPGQTRLALSGLVRNAIEAAPAGGWASVRIERQGTTLALIVEDNGGGPPANAVEHLFDPFFSGRSAGRGRGMGLPVAWRLARQA